jgi:Zn-dependent peptidase ImmA (M78 family)
LANQSVFKRGFKAQSERLALEYRSKLSIQAWAPLCAFKLAGFLNIPIFNATDFLTTQAEREMLADDCGWSALTMETAAGNRIIIHNEFHSSARQQSNIMHELAHVICEHKIPPSKYDFPIPIGMRTFDEVQEEEAAWLGSALQIAKPCLLWALKRKLSVSEIASHFNASDEMVSYRIRMSGAAKQSSYQKKRVSA